MANHRWAIFVSGTGSNLASVMSLRFHLHVACVVSSRSQAVAVNRALRNSIPVLCPRLQEASAWTELSQTLKLRKVERILLLGFMKIVPELFLKDWEGEIWNLHPSLLPRYKGAQALEKSFEAKSAMGVSLHEVNREMDEGKVHLQSRVIAAEKSENLETARFWIHKEEQRLVRQWVGYK
ncbi:MAG: hypothetical protein LW875_06400 [Proteobacteria bacterium]|nr:hypothetical protein [Pseudomonadota bacterium]